VVGCWVNGTTLVRFTVGALDPIPTLCDRYSCSTTWTDAVTPAASPALLLTSDTELLVAPKTRHAPPPASSTKSHDLASTSADQSHRPTTAAEWDAVKKKLVRLLPLELNPLERHDDDGKLLQNGISEEDTAAMDEGTAYVSPALYRQFRKLLPNLRCVLSHHTRPVPKPAPSEKKEEEGAATGSERAVLVEVKIREGRNVGVDHVWVGEKLRQDLGLVDGGESGGYELLK
jgi:peroxin-1